MKFKYTNPEQSQILGELAAGETLGNMSNPAGAAAPLVFSIGMSPGNKEFDELQALIKSKKASVSAYVEPEPAVIDEISDRQFFQQLAIDGDITEAEALAAVKTGDIPAALQAIIDALPQGDRFNAEMLLSGATTFKFSNPLTLVLGSAMNRTPAQMKELWRNAANLV